MYFVYIKAVNFVLETCEEEPPLLKNGKPREFARTNGSFIDYECEEGYELEGHSSVHCEFGAWVGQLPDCKSCKYFYNSLHDVIRFSTQENNNFVC